MAFQTKALQGYNSNSAFQLHLALKLIPRITKYLRLSHSLNPSILNIADYGSSEGYNSMIIFQKVLQEFRSSHSTPISISHTDLPQNNWTTLFSTIQTSPESYRSIPNIYHSAIGHSFYNQLFPSNSIHFGFSSCAFHFLSKVPPRTGEPRFVYPEATIQMKEDLTNNLSFRIKELVVGGHLVFLIVAKDEKFMFEHLFFDPLKRLVAKGIISKNEYLNIYAPACPLTESEIKEVLAVFKGKIEVIDLQTEKNVPCFYEDYVRNKDFDEYKKKIYGMIWPVWQNALGAAIAGRSEQEKDKIMVDSQSELIDSIDDQEWEAPVHIGVVKKISN